MSVAYSFTKTQRDGSLGGGRTDSPGPNNYNPDRSLRVVKDSSPEWTFSRSQRQGDSDQNPGPGAYDQDANRLRMNVQYSMGNRSALGLSNNNNDIYQHPGPGSYDPQPLNKPPAYSLGGKRPDPRPSNIPGPGYYEVNNNQSLLSSSAKYNNASPFGAKSKRDTTSTLLNSASNKERLMSPGPGTYSPKHDATKYKNPTFGMNRGQKGITSKDIALSQSVRNPGPGAYDGSSKQIGKNLGNINMGSRPQTAKVSTTPGPGAYSNHNRTITETAKSQRGVSAFKNKSERLTSLNRDQVKNPGPGAYEADANKVKDKVRAAMFGKVKRDNFFSKEDKSKPGPGNYEIPDMKSNRGFKIGQKVQSTMKNQTPGPGNYEPNPNVIKDSIRNAKISSSNKSQFLSASKSYQLLPGPGQYDSVKKFGEGIPTYSIRGRAKDGRLDNSPAPGQYDPTDAFSKDRIPSATIQSGSKRFTQAQSNSNVGPGQYNEMSKKIGSEVKSFSFRPKPKDQPTSNIPGPGAYDANQNVVKDAIRNAAISHSKRQDIVSKQAKEMPGPVNYADINTFGKRAPSFSIQSKREEKKRDQVPGPGAYSANDTIHRDKSPSYRMGNGQRTQVVQKEQLINPGPGNYEVQQKIGNHGPQYSFKSRIEPKIKDQSPGPGGYDPNPNLIKDNLRGFQMSRSTRQDIVSKEAKQLPGPGNYRSPTKQGYDGPKYTMGGRSKSRQELSPGPGQYEPVNTLTKDNTSGYAISNTLRSDLVAKHVKQQPGPGQYLQADEFGNNAKSFQIRGKPDDKIKSEVPGPGSYSADPNLIKDRVISHKVSNSQRTQLVTKEITQKPGPGEYDSPKRFGEDVKTVTIRGKPKDLSRDDIPGPGNYDPDVNNVKDRTVAYKMSNSKRQDAVSKEARELPGPGKYGSPDKQGYEGPKYTMGGRSKSRQELGPGPGQYEPVNTLTKDKVQGYAISNTLRSELVAKHVNQQPGPGYYASVDKFGSDAKSFQIRGKPEDKNQSDVPGPGSYAADPNLIKDRVISHKVSQSQRAQLVTKEMLYQPGPGEYDSPKRFGEDAQSVTIRGRSKDINRNDSPGPGNYDPDVSTVKDRAIAYKMSNSKRTDAVSKEVRDLPGPGNYDQNSQIGRDNKAYTIGGKPKDMRDSQIPGPGHYEANDQLTRDQALTAFKISQSARGDIVSKEDLMKPGPGNYAYSKNFGEDAKTFSIRGKPSDKVGNDIPGPGQYEAHNDQIKDRIIAHKIDPTTKRTDLVSRESLNAPGPGQYESPSKLNNKSFTIGQRVESPGRNEVPGPGVYNLDESAVRHQNPSFKIDSHTQRTQLVNREQLSLPGPGNYRDERAFGADAQTFSIRGKPQDNQRSNVPGPGQYEAQHDSIKDNAAKSFRMPQTKRDFLSVDKESLMLPGPGQYDLPSSNQGKTFTMGGGGWPGVDNGVPGPGTYEQTQDQIRHQNPAFDFSRSPDRSHNNSPQRDYQQPGPGQYDSRDQNLTGYTPIVYSIPKGEVKPPASDTPGPGHYKIPCKFADTPSYSGINQNEDFRYV